MIKIDALTSLRFFASAAIVFLHSRPAFETTRNMFLSWPLQYGVTFFFVLSGFILTYVYRAVPSKREFYVARLARIWPAHIAAVALFLILLPRGQWIWEGANPVLVPLANLALVQSIIPIPEYYFSMNGVSWSISTEMFFYAAFPFLLTDWSKTFHWKLAGGLLLAGLMVLASEMLRLPPFSPARFLDVTAHGLVYISPLARIFEFMLGMFAAKLAMDGGMHTRGHSRSALVWTGAETAALALAIGMAFYCSSLPGRLGATEETALATYLGHSSGAVFFAIMIGVFAFQGGLLSRALRAKPLVVLGEISFSLYLVHQILLRWYQANMALFNGIESAAKPVIYWTVSIAVAYLIWRFFELPMRSWLRSALVRRPAVGAMPVQL